MNHVIGVAFYFEMLPITKSQIFMLVGPYLRKISNSMLVLSSTSEDCNQSVVSYGNHEALLVFILFLYEPLIIL